MAEKRPRGLRPWLDDIQLDDSGKYAYQGSHMKFSGGDGGDGAYRAFRLKLGVCAVLLAGCKPGGPNPPDDKQVRTDPGISSMQ